MTIQLNIAAALSTAAILLGGTAAFASGTHAGGHGHDAEASIGQAGDPAHVDRIIQVEMGEMFFSPGTIEVRAGETIRFVVSNTGDFVHEFNVGTTAMHMAHLEEMEQMMASGVLEAHRINHNMMSATQMAHDDANSVLVEPGKAAEIIWTFNGDAELELSCNVPGHREGGMIGPIRVNDGQS